MSDTKFILRKSKSHRTKGLLIGPVLFFAGLTGWLGYRVTNMIHAAGVYQVPSTIAADCSTDVTWALNNWIASVPNGAAGSPNVIEFGANACYLSQGTITMVDRNYLTISGNGATIKATIVGVGGVYNNSPQNRTHIWMRGGKGLTFRNLKIQGINKNHAYTTAYEGQHGFQTSGSQDVLIENVNVNEVYGDCFVFFSDIYRSWKWTSGVTVRNSICTHPGRHGMAVIGAQHVLFEKNKSGPHGYAFVDLEPDGGTGAKVDGIYTYGGGDDIKILNNEVYKPQAGYVFSVTTADIMDNVEFSGNQIKESGMGILIRPPAGKRWKNYTIKNNVSFVVHGSAYGGPIQVENVDNVLVESNTAPVNPAINGYPNGITGVEVKGVNTAVIKNNILNGAARATTTDADGPIYQGNLIKWNGAKSTNVSSCGNTYGRNTTIKEAACTTSTNPAPTAPTPPASTTPTPNSPTNTTNTSTDNLAAPEVVITPQVTTQSTPVSVAEKATAVAQKSISAPFEVADKATGILFGNSKDPLTGKPKSFSQQSLPRRIAVATITSLLLGVALFFGSRGVRQLGHMLWHWRAHQALVSGQLSQGSAEKIITPKDK